MTSPRTCGAAAGVRCEVSYRSEGRDDDRDRLDALRWPRAVRRTPAGTDSPRRVGISHPAWPAWCSGRQPSRAADGSGLPSSGLAHSRIPEITRHSGWSDAMTSIEASAQLVLPTETGTADVEIVVPVYNEERDLAPSVRRLHAYLHHEFPFPTVITIADNASTDGTWPI